MIRGTHPEVAKVLREAARQGATIRFTGSGHIQVRTGMGVTHLTASHKNGSIGARVAKQQLRKIGILIK